MVFGLNANGIVTSNRMRAYMPGQVNLNPPKRIARLKELLQTQAPNICVVRGEGIGDVLMVTPLLSSLKNLFPGGARITFATNTRYLEGALVKVLEHNPDIDKVIDRENLDESDYDLVINLHCPAIAYEAGRNPPLNRIDIFAQHAGVPLTTTQVRYYPTSEEIATGKIWLEDNGIRQHHKILMVHLFSSASMRNLDIMPMREAIQFFSRAGVKTILLRNDSDPATDITWDNLPNITTFKGDIRQIAGVMKHCNLLLCPDSSVLHLAGAMGTATVSIFSHTDPRARINYYPKAEAIWPGQQMQCCPCWSAATCRMHLTCMKILTGDMIVQACLKRLNG